MNDWIFEELEKLEQKHPDFRGIVACLWPYKFEARSFDEAFQNEWGPDDYDQEFGIPIPERMNEFGEAVRDLNAISVHVLKAFPKVNWPEANSTAGSVLARVLMHSFEEDPELLVAQTEANCFYEVRIFLRSQSDRWVQFQNRTEVAKHLNVSKGAITHWFNKKAEWIRESNGGIELDSQHPKAKPKV